MSKSIIVCGIIASISVMPAWRERDEGVRRPLMASTTAASSRPVAAWAAPRDTACLR